MPGFRPVVAVLCAKPDDRPPGLDDLPVDFRFCDAAGLADAVRGAQGLLLWDFFSTAVRDVWNDADALEWIHITAAGVDTLLFDELRDSAVVVTNARGVFDRPLAEFVLGAVIAGKPMVLGIVINRIFGEVLDNYILIAIPLFVLMGLLVSVSNVGRDTFEVAESLLRRIAGGAALSGIGFTISLFIVDIAIAEPERQDQARIGVLAASVLAFVFGWVVFRITDWLSPPEPVGLKLLRPVAPDRDHVRGRHDAPLTLVEYGDFECPFCSRATGSIDEVRDHFGDRLRYVWRHFPLERAHPRAFDAARASEAAALQGRFWEMARELFDHQDDLEWSDMYRYAVAAGCDIDQFDQDVRVHSSKVLHRVTDDAEDAEAMDLNATPTLFVNGIRHRGPWDAASLIRALEASRATHS